MDWKKRQPILNVYAVLPKVPIIINIGEEFRNVLPNLIFFKLHLKVVFFSQEGFYKDMQCTKK